MGISSTIFFSAISLLFVDSTPWCRYFSKSNQRYYYANSLTNEKLFEAKGCEPNSGWTREDNYYFDELRKYRNVYNGEVRYDHEVGGTFDISKTFPVNESEKQPKKRKFNTIDNNDNQDSIRNESKDHMDQPPSSRIANRRIPSPSTTSSSSYPFPTQSSSSSFSSSQHRTMKVANNFLTLQSQKHANWLFGGIAELIHNASDANATQISINYFQDTAHDNDSVLEICDNGIGMSPYTVQNILLSFGRDYDPNQRDLDRIGCYGVGFKQGSIRIGSTVIFVTKFHETKTITLGILCNKPYEDKNEMFIYESATISYPSCRVNETYCTEQQYEKTTKLMAQYSFLNRENISLLIQKHFQLEQTGTLIFIQDWRKGFDRLVFDFETKDFLLYSNLQSFDSSSSSSSSSAAAGSSSAAAAGSSSSSAAGSSSSTAGSSSSSAGGGGGGGSATGSSTLSIEKRKHLFRQTCHDTIDRSTIIWMDCSLKEYLKYIFYQTNIQLSLCNQVIQTSRIESELTHLQPLHLLPSINGHSPISGFIGKSQKWEQQKIGGAMLYASNCLIRSFVRNEIGVYNPSDGWGIVLIVNIPVGITRQGSGINTTQDKQNFEGNAIYIQLLQKISHEYRKYIQKTEFPIEKISLSSRGGGGGATGAAARGASGGAAGGAGAAGEGGGEGTGEGVLDTIHSHWIQCEQCGKWRRIPEEVQKKFHGNIPFYCYHQFSPIMIEILKRDGNVNNERTRRMACERSQEDYSEEKTQSITTGYEEDFNEQQGQDEEEQEEQEGQEKEEEVEQEEEEEEQEKEKIQPKKIEMKKIKVKKEKEENESEWKKESKKLSSSKTPSSSSSSAASAAASAAQSSSSSLTQHSQSSQSDDLPLPLPDLFYVLHHPSELQFNWKGEITSIQRIEPERQTMTKNYDSLYAHLHLHETELSHTQHSLSSSPSPSPSPSPYYTCTSDLLYALYLSYHYAQHSQPQQEQQQQGPQQQQQQGPQQQQERRCPIIKIKSNYIQTLPMNENVFNLSSVSGLNECQMNGKLTSKQVASVSSKCINSSCFILRVGLIPSRAIEGIYNPFPISLGHSSSVSSSASRPHVAGTTLRQSLSRLHHFLSSGYLEWKKQVHLLLSSSSSSSSFSRLESLQSEMRIEPILESSPTSSSSAAAGGRGAGGGGGATPLPVVINEFHLKLSLFFNILPLIPFWLSDLLMKILSNFILKRYNSCVSLIRGCYKHPHWMEFYQKIREGDQSYAKTVSEGLKAYRKDVRNVAKNNEISADLEVVGELKILFNRLKGS
jgi:hypothetical protein